MNLLINGGLGLKPIYRTTFH